MVVVEHRVDRRRLPGGGIGDQIADGVGGLVEERLDDRCRGHDSAPVGGPALNTRGACPGKSRPAWVDAGGRGAAGGLPRQALRYSLVSTNSRCPSDSAAVSRPLQVRIITSIRASPRSDEHTSEL